METVIGTVIAGFFLLLSAALVLALLWPFIFVVAVLPIIAGFQFGQEFMRGRR